MRPTVPLSFVAIAVAMNFLWGGNLVAVKLGLTAVPPFWSAFSRFALAALALFLWAQWRGVSLLLKPGELRQIWGLSAVFAVQITLMNFGTDLTSAGVATVLNSTNPLFAALAAHFLFSAEHLGADRLGSDRLTLRRTLGQLLAFAGVCLILLHREPEALASSPWVGNLLVLGSGILLGTRLAISAKLVRCLERSRVIFWQVLLPLPYFALGGLLFERIDLAAVGWVPLAALAYQGWVIAGLGFMVTASLYQHYPASLVASFNFLAPVFGVWMSIFLLGESLSGWLLGGLAIVSGGLLIITLGERPPVPSLTPSLPSPPPSSSKATSSAASSTD